MSDGDFYGAMRPLPVKVTTTPVTVPCSKCGGNFILEKNHHELFLVKMFWAKTREGVLTPATPKPDSYHRLCPSCTDKFKVWIAEK
jgi:hypothetical protein